MTNNEEIIREYMLQQGWIPPTGVALEQQKQDISNVQLGAKLPNMQNPFNGYGVPLPDQLTSFQQVAAGVNLANNVQESQGLYQRVAHNLDPLVDKDMGQAAFEVQNHHNVQLAANAPVNTLPAEIFLRSTFIEGKVIQRVAPQLVFLDMATRFTTDAIDIVWFRNNFSPDTEPASREPAPIGEDGRFPRSEVGDPVKKMGSTGMWGEAIDFTRRALRHTNSAVDDIQRKIDWVAWKLAKKINTIYGNVLTGSFSTSQTGNDAAITEAADTTWDDPLRNPIKDIRDLALKMKTENGHYFAPNELWLTPEQHRELLDYLTSVDHHWAMDPRTNTPINQIDGIRIIEAPPASGVPDGFGIMLARNTGPQFGMPLTVWDAVDPEFTRTGIIHTDRYRDPETKRVSVLMWKEFFVANRNPKAVGLLHSM